MNKRQRKKAIKKLILRHAEAMTRLFDNMKYNEEFYDIIENNDNSVTIISKRDMRVPLFKE